MKNFNLLLAFFLISSITIFTCKKTPEPQPPDNQPVNPYENCCNTSALDTMVGMGNIYIPNIFTPNADGFNDLFMALPDENISTVDTFQIFITAGDVVFIVHEIFDYAASNFNEYAWDGTDQNGEMHEGSFDYFIAVTSANGAHKNFRGTACSCVCEANMPCVTADESKCQFAIQHDGWGNFDPNLPHHEEDCID